MPESTNNILLSVDQLDVRFRSNLADVHAVKDISFNIETGRSLGLVGESGSGKSVTGLSLLGLFRNNESVNSYGSIRFRIDDKIVSLDEIEISTLQKIRGSKIGLILQEPGSTLNPNRKCGKQLIEVLKIHNIGEDSQHKKLVLQAFEQVALSDTSRIFNAYPHELSGGQLQRVCIAMAIVCDPLLLICDEITSALDVSIQKEIIDLLKDLRERLNLTLLFISHDLDVVKELCDEVLIMKDGQIIERGHTRTIFSHPQENYTQELLLNKPSLLNLMAQVPLTQKGNKVLDINGLSHKYERKSVGFLRRKQYDTVLDDISFALHQSEILGIVGESGSGKSTIAKAIVGVITPVGGEIDYYTKDRNLIKLGATIRKDIQLIFQDPYSALNPSISIGRSIYELLSYHKLCLKSETQYRVIALLNKVGLSDEYYDRLPSQLSGGQRQRVCIAKALALEPRILICDECVSALDVTVQARIIKLLLKIRDELGISIIFISHDLAVINMLCERVIVMQSGRIVESGSPQDIINNPQQPYTRALIQSIPGYNMG